MSYPLKDKLDAGLHEWRSLHGGEPHKIRMKKTTWHALCEEFIAYAGDGIHEVSIEPVEGPIDFHAYCGIRIEFDEVSLIPEGCCIIE